MNWVKKHKLPAIEAIQHNGQLCIKLEDLWQALHLSFNSAQNHQIDCYDLKSLEWDRRTTLILSNTRKLDRDLLTN